MLNKAFMNIIKQKVVWIEKKYESDHRFLKNLQLTITASSLSK